MSSPKQRNPSWNTRAMSADARECSFQQFRLTVVAGPDTDLEATSDGPELSIGTAPANQLVLTDGAVSRHHCSIGATGTGFLLIDLDSTNGTGLEGFRIQGAYLEDGAIIQLGETQIRFEATGGEIRQRLSNRISFGQVLGNSPAMRRLFAILPKVSASDAAVLLTGETGTGKGLLAESIHRASPRNTSPFAVVDCGAIASSLIESELFGHVRGSFTGATEDRVGVFQSATGGTVFLDEIGELALELQPKLLRVLERKTVTPVGSTEPVDIDVRIIAATNRDLREEVNRGAFREDLFYRLDTVGLRLPPLRERREDIAGLTAHFYRQLSGDPQASPPAELIARFIRQRWPGNVRELRSAIERALLLGADDFDTSKELDPFDYRLTFRAAKESAVALWEQEYLAGLIQQYGGNLSRAARAVKMDRNHLRELLKRHGIDPKR